MQVYFTVNVGRKVIQAGAHLIDGVPSIILLVLLNAVLTV